MNKRPVGVSSNLWCPMKSFRHHFYKFCLEIASQMADKDDLFLHTSAGSRQSKEVYLLKMLVFIVLLFSFPILSKRNDRNKPST